MSRFCGRCGAPAAPGNPFCVSCGSALEPQIAGTAGTSPAVFPPAAPPGPPSGLPSLAGQTPWAAWPPPSKRGNTRIIVAVVVIAVVAIVIFSVIVILANLNQSRATFVNITKGGASGDSMFFNLTIRTSGAAIEIDELRVDLRSVRGGVTFDRIVYSNLERIPGGTLFIWELDIAIDPFDEPSFSYVFTLEVDGSGTDSSTVS